MLNDGCKLLQDPTSGIDGKGQLPEREALVSVDHGKRIKSQEDQKLNQLDDDPGPRNDQAMVVEQASLFGVVDGYGQMLVVVRQDVDKRQGCIRDLASIDRIDDAMACGRANEELALGHDGEFKSRELHLMAATLLDRPLHVPPLLLKVARSSLEGIEALDEDACEHKKPRLPWIGLMETTENLRGH